MTPPRRVAAGALALGIAVAIAWLSRAPTTYAGPGDALLRLSWRAQGIRIEECRPRTQEELEALAPHMRTPEVCVGGGADHELRVVLDGAERVLDTVAAGGARGDRPIYVHRDIELAPGLHRLAVRFRALLPESLEPEPAPDFRFEGPVEVGATEVVLITLDAAAGELVRVDP